MDLTPDEFRYYGMAQGVRGPRPFHYRWLLPRLCGPRPRVWLVVQCVSFLAVSGLLWAYTGEWWACLLTLGLSGLTFNLKHPMLVDLPALACALAAAVCWQQGWWIAALALALVSGTIKESAPTFAALFAWNPVLLVGLLPVALRHLQSAGTDPIPDGPAHDALVHPIRVSWEHHKQLPLWAFVLPWGVLLAGLTNGSPQLWATLAVAYAQLLVATDNCRLTVMAVPVFALAAVPVLGPWALLAVVLHLVNPFRTEGL